MTTELTDSHVHFDACVAAGTFTEVLGRAVAAGVGRMMAIGGHPAANELALQLAAAHPTRIRAAVGYDRDLAADVPALETLERQLQAPGAAAVGEFGLDYHYAADSASAQRALVAAQIVLSHRYRQPIVLHTREADDDTLAAMREHAAGWPGAPDRLGVVHCFTGSLAFAHRLLDLGLHLSFSGIVTFRNADALREVARSVPADRLLIETDAPFLAPVPYRGQPNEPAWVRRVAEVLAETRGVPLEELADQTSRNAAHLFGW